MGLEAIRKLQLRRKRRPKLIDLRVGESSRRPPAPPPSGAARPRRPGARRPPGAGGRRSAGRVEPLAVPWPPATVASGWTNTFRSGSAAPSVEDERVDAAARRHEIEVRRGAGLGRLDVGEVLRAGDDPELLVAADEVENLLLLRAA